jgi:hypothetical protein
MDLERFGEKRYAAGKKTHPRGGRSRSRVVGRPSSEQGIRDGHTRHCLSIYLSNLSYIYIYIGKHTGFSEDRVEVENAAKIEVSPKAAA